MSLNIKAEILDKECNNRKFWQNFKFEVKFGSNGVATICLNDEKTKYNAVDYGYDKISVVIAKMINDITVDDCKYNNGKKLSESGVGMSALIDSFNNKRGCKLEYIYGGIDSIVYELTISDKIIIKEEEL